ncbi:prepilin-type N-terminal cleavage/methylation domain-containing protein [Pseudomonas sp. PDM14]|uniref:type IV pilin protein n=1 Tax=Pseudomonas sp. PDM14 TaxID=2769288 RepID=UPI0017831CB5|nr:type IV pilin protein [Pseudomonas sp. PDM14]MBD9485372.1 prepilin-type N-terminal cleavage/methylation domain-containing protein [Pseudomonas sp. PDM14]
MKGKTRIAGFTLIELMLAVAIIGILAAIATPNYLEYITRSKRSEGHALLIEAATRQERFYAQNSRYVTDNNDIALLALRNTDSGTKKVASENGYYKMTISTAAGDGGYTLTAAQEIGDGQCGNLTLTALGTKGRTGSGKTVEQCWK